MARVLIADDDTDIRDLVEFKLTQAGHTVVTTGDGPSALDAIRRDRPDIAVLDVMMPGMSGVDVCRAVRADRETAELPVILLTARAQERDIEDGFAVGADDYVVKPFSPRELIRRLNAVLTRAAR